MGSVSRLFSVALWPKSCFGATNIPEGFAWGCVRSLNQLIPRVNEVEMVKPGVSGGPLERWQWPEIVDRWDCQKETNRKLHLNRDGSLGSNMLPDSIVKRSRMDAGAGQGKT